ncbi:MAG TPA: DUF4010 domain-containing protein [Actinobacteria bacterium]|nr:DUF4010 domain-containing protein [Actinomycetota bacterium]
MENEVGGMLQAFLVAAGSGAVVGLERQVAGAHRSTVLGVRTFTLYAVWGAGSGLVGDRYGPAAFAAMAVAFAGLLVGSYVVSSRVQGDWGTTTEAAAAVTYVIGVVSWLGQPVVAIALAVGLAALLRAKEPIEEWTDLFTEEDLRALLQFGVITALILPLAPDEPLGPFGAFNPHRIWLMVVLVSAISLVGYVALRFLGRRGLGLTGLLGGLVSSTAVTLGFSRMSRQNVQLAPVLAAGIIAASTVMYPRVLVEAAVVEPRLASELVGVVAVLAALTGAAAVFWWRRAERRRPGDDEPAVDLVNPLTLSAALGFGALYAAVVFVSKLLEARVSPESLQIVGAISGINDVDAITLSTANLVAEGLDPALGAKVVLIAVVVNTFVKAGLAAFLASPRVRGAVAAGLVPAGIVGLLFWAFA